MTKNTVKEKPKKWRWESPPTTSEEVKRRADIIRKENKIRFADMNNDEVHKWNRPNAYEKNKARKLKAEEEAKRIAELGDYDVGFHPNDFSEW
jgi:hypothetical protein